MHGVHAQRLVVAEHERADVQRRARLRRHPILLHLHKRFNRLKHFGFVHLRQAEPLGGIVHPADVFDRAEQLHRAVRPAVRFHPFKNLGTIVEHH